MKSKLLLAITLIFALALSFFPPAPVSAAEPEVWVLTGVQIKPPEGYLEWNQPFGDLNTLKTITISPREFTYRSKTTRDGETTANLFYQFAFDTPPDELVPGESINLKIAGSLTGSAFTIYENSLTLYLQERTKDNAIKSVLAAVRLTLDELGSPAPQALQFVVPETSDGKLVIQTANTVAAQVEILWVYEPGESQETAPGETAETEPAGTTGTGVGSVSGLQAEKFFTIGWVVGSTGEVYIERGGKRIKMRKGMPVMAGDILTTLDTGLARIELDDKGTNKRGDPIGPSMVNVAPNSEMGFESFRALVDNPVVRGIRERSPEPEGLFGLIKGKMRTLLSGWETNRSFDVKAGVSVCGIRGSDVFISYDPDTERVEAYVIEGHMDVTNSETGETKSLTDNQKLVVENGNIGEIQPLSQAEWDSLVKENGVEDMQPMSQAELDRLLAEKNGESSGSLAMPVIIGVGAVVIVGLALFGLRKRLKKA